MILSLLARGGGVREGGVRPFSLTIGGGHPRKWVRMTETGGKFKGGSLHVGFGGFDGFGGSGEHLALLLLVLQNIVPRDSGGSGRDGYPP